MKKYKVTFNELEIDFIIIALGSKIREIKDSESWFSVLEEYQRIKDRLENLKAETA